MYLSLASPNCHKSSVYWRPVVGVDSWKFRMLGHFLIVKVARLSKACSFIKLNNPVVEIEDHELVQGEVG
jgi:hypothetical protein